MSANLHTISGGKADDGLSHLPIYRDGMVRVSDLLAYAVKRANQIAPGVEAGLEAITQSKGMLMLAQEIGIAAVNAQNEPEVDHSTEVG